MTQSELAQTVNNRPDHSRAVQAISSKIVGLIHWWIQLSPIRHRHWCDNNWKCEHQGSCWYCDGIFCVGQQTKNCPGCAQGKPCPPVPLDKRYYGYRCECGLGRE